VYIELSEEDVRRLRVLEHAGGYRRPYDGIVRVLDDAVRQGMVRQMQRIERLETGHPDRADLPELYRAIETP
jgi:hypothetical protein